MIATTKAFRLQAINLVDINLKDLASLRVQCEEEAPMGLNGQQVIHPGQIPVVQQAFAPFAENISWATELIHVFQQHQQEGKGAFTFRCHMIDMPLLKHAQNIVDLSKAISPAAEQTSDITADVKPNNNNRPQNCCIMIILLFTLFSLHNQQALFYLAILS